MKRLPIGKNKKNFHKTYFKFSVPQVNKHSGYSMFWKILSKEKRIDLIFHNDINYKQRRFHVLHNILVSGV